jgi:hypothetical protein
MMGGCYTTYIYSVTILGGWVPKILVCSRSLSQSSSKINTVPGHLASRGGITQLHSLICDRTRRPQRYPKSHELLKVLVLYDGEQAALSNGTKATCVDEFRLLDTSEYNTRRTRLDVSDVDAQPKSKHDHVDGLHAESKAIKVDA